MDSFYPIIDKTEVAHLVWPKEETITDLALKSELRNKLHTALVLGNIEKCKCFIVFNDYTGTKMIYTTIWAVCEKNIQLKFGLYIPIHRILDIKI